MGKIGRVAVALVVGFGLVIGCCGANKIPDTPSSVVISWSDAKELAGIEDKWKLPCPIIWDENLMIFNGNRLLGVHQWRFTVADKGKIKYEERIVIYLTKFEIENRPDLVVEVLTHEFLHAIYFRMAVQDPHFEFNNPDKEAWVRALME